MNNFKSQTPKSESIKLSTYRKVKLPIEIWFMIVSHLDTISAIKLGMCNLSFHSIIKNSYLDFLNINEKYERRITERVLNNYPKIKKFKLYGSLDTSNISNILKHLEVLDISELSDYGFNPINVNNCINFNDFVDLRKIIVLNGCYKKHLKEKNTSLYNFIKEKKILIISKISNNLYTNCTICIDDEMASLFGFTSDDDSFDEISYLFDSLSEDDSSDEEFIVLEQKNSNPL